MASVILGLLDSSGLSGLFLRSGGYQGQARQEGREQSVLSKAGSGKNGSGESGGSVGHGRRRDNLGSGVGDGRGGSGVSDCGSTNNGCGGSVGDGSYNGGGNNLGDWVNEAILVVIFGESLKGKWTETAAGGYSITIDRVHRSGAGAQSSVEGAGGGNGDKKGGQNLF